MWLLVHARDILHNILTNKFCVNEGNGQRRGPVSWGASRSSDCKEKPTLRWLYDSAGPVEAHPWKRIA